MRVAVIDIGTNSVRCDIRDLRSSTIGGELLYREKVVIRLGRTVFETGEIDPESADRLFSALEIYKRSASELDVGQSVIVATSAMREASNGPAIVAEIQRRFGFAVDIISGEREAALIARGILAFEPELPTCVLLFDIGGGSTEFSFYENGNVLFCESLAIGALRVQQLLLRTHPPDAVAVSAARKQIRSLLSQFDGRWSEKPALIGSSGSVKAMLRIRSGAAASEEIKTGELPRAKIDSLVGEMTPLDAGGLLQIPNMDPHRIEVILAGALITQEIVSYFGGDTVRVTDYSLRDGLYDEIGEALGVQR